MAKSAEQFAKAVIAAGLSTAEAIKALWGQTPAEKRPKDGPSFSKLLIEEEVLTEFQAAEILAGRETPLVLGDYFSPPLEPGSQPLAAAPSESSRDFTRNLSRPFLTNARTL